MLISPINTIEYINTNIINTFHTIYLNVRTMSKERKLIGMSKVAVGWKITLLREVADKLNADIGDKIVFIEENGKICIEKA